MYIDNDTIAAIASPTGASLRGIIRISGPQTAAIVRSVASQPLELPTTAARVSLDVDTRSRLGTIQASLLFWPDHRSYTRSPSAELHLPGSMPVLESVLQRLLKLGARLADPGEFTMRAFLAGQLDLTQAEAVLGVIDAQDRQGLDTALRQLSGGLSQPLGRLRTELLNLLAHLEAGLDFVEEDIQFISAEDLLRQTGSVRQQIEAIEHQMQQRQGGHRAPQVVLRGEPNAGKSSLLNALAQQDVAIVSEQSGTTRDLVHAKLRCGDVEVMLIDTAGIESGDDVIATDAQALGEQASCDAELLLACVECNCQQLPDWCNQLEANASRRGREVLWVATKSDTRQQSPAWAGDRWLLTSSVTGQGIDQLMQRIEAAIRTSAGSAGGDGNSVAATAVRCGQTLSDASAALARAESVIVAQAGDELIAAELRVALDAIGQVTGAVYTDDILDRIFSEFCIGK